MADESKTQLYQPEGRLSFPASRSLSSGRCMEDPVCRRRLSPASRRLCCNAFGLGLSYGISAASLLAIVFVFVELSYIKTELDLVRSQLQKQQQLQQQIDDVSIFKSDGLTNFKKRSDHQSGAQSSTTSENLFSQELEHHGRRHRQQHVHSAIRDQQLTEQGDDDMVSSDGDQHANDLRDGVRRKTKRSVSQSQGRHSSTGRNMGVTQDQVQQLIRHSTSMLHHPSAHLAFQPPRNGSLLDEGRALHWTEHHNSRLAHNHLFGYGDNYGSLVVQSSGTYLIYVQITYNGRSIVRQPTCSHAVKLFPTESPNDAKSLLYGSVTQYNQGRTIHTNSDGIPVRAFDSVFEAGVFHLEIGDQLRVEMDDFSRNCHIKATIDRTFFGAIRIQSKDVDI